jgi:hypothetical protein
LFNSERKRAIVHANNMKIHIFSVNMICVTKAA